MVDLKISAEPLHSGTCIEFVMSAATGGINVFIGTVREKTKGKQVTGLHFEAYESMALHEMKKIAEEVKLKWPVDKIAIHHRTGKLNIGEIPVIIAVSAAHRAAAFEACRYIIDTLKERVPIWKKELFEDGEVWVAAHP